jgi:hypothetical protein
MYSGIEPSGVTLRKISKINFLLLVLERYRQPKLTYLRFSLESLAKKFEKSSSSLKEADNA